MTISEKISTFASAFENGCKTHLPAPIVNFGGRIYSFLSFREMKTGENKALYYIRESIATLAKAYFLVAVTTFTIIALKASGSLLISSIIFGTIFAIARSEKIANLFPKSTNASV